MKGIKKGILIIIQNMKIIEIIRKSEEESAKRMPPSTSPDMKDKMVKILPAYVYFNTFSPLYDSENDLRNGLMRRINLFVLEIHNKLIYMIM